MLPFARRVPSPPRQLGLACNTERLQNGVRSQLELLESLPQTAMETHEASVGRKRSGDGTAASWSCR